MTTTVTGSGKIITKPVKVPAFSRIEATSAFDVSIAIGENADLVLRIDDNLVDLVDVGVSNGTLHLDLKPNTSVRRATLRAEVTARSVSGIDISGAAKVRLADVISGQKLDVTAAGAGRLDGTIRVDEASIDLSGSSDVKLAGSARSLALNESGASHIDAQQLQADDLTTDLSGASRADVSVTNTISATVSGGSSLRYRGSPCFTQKDISGGASITPL
jgi:hypothetical protein